MAHELVIHAGEVNKTGGGTTNLTYEQQLDLADRMSKSQMVPVHYRHKPNDILLAIHMGSEVGIKPIQAIQNIVVINGKPAIYGDLALALVRKHEEFEDIEEKIEGEDEKMVATCSIKRRRQTPVIRTFAVDEAKKAGLWGKGVWRSYPKRMLQMRARGFAMRDSFPDALCGLITSEEAVDYVPGTSLGMIPLQNVVEHQSNEPSVKRGDFGIEV